LGKLKVALIILLVGAGAGYYYWFRHRPTPPPEVAYVLTPSVQIVDTLAEVHSNVATVQNGQRLEVLERDGDWARVRLASGVTGWMESRNLMTSETYDRAQALLQKVKTLPEQAVGHTSFEANLRLKPSPGAPILEQMPQQQALEIYGRRMVARLPAASEAGAEETSEEEKRGASPAGPREAWYLVRTDSRAGWVLGRLVTLDIPQAISVYAQNINLVAWLVLNTVEDQGNAVPQYLVADRIGAPDVDFNHIRVFTWWAKKQHYATAYVEGNLVGYFPIRVEQRGNVPYFRLRLLEPGGAEVQKVYELENTIVRPLGIVEGWSSDALPVSPLRPHRAGRARRSRR
jgi:Bacterial SH3 domain